MKLANSLVVFVMTTFKKVRLFYIINKFIDIISFVNISFSQIYNLSKKSQDPLA